MEKVTTNTKKFKISKYSIRNMFKKTAPAEPSLDELFQAKMRLNARIAQKGPLNNNRAKLNETKTSMVEVKNEREDQEEEEGSSSSRRSNDRKLNEITKKQKANNKLVDTVNSDLTHDLAESPVPTADRVVNDPLEDPMMRTQRSVDDRIYAKEVKMKGITEHLKGSDSAYGSKQKMTKEERKVLSRNGSATKKSTSFNMIDQMFDYPANTALESAQLNKSLKSNTGKNLSQQLAHTPQHSQGSDEEEEDNKEIHE